MPEIWEDFRISVTSVSSKKERVNMNTPPRKMKDNIQKCKEIVAFRSSIFLANFFISLSYFFLPYRAKNPLFAQIFYQRADFLLFCCDRCGNQSALYKNVTTCARVQPFFGAKVVLDVPAVISFFTAHITGS